MFEFFILSLMHVGQHLLHEAVVVEIIIVIIVSSNRQASIAIFDLLIGCFVIALATFCLIEEVTITKASCLQLL